MQEQAHPDRLGRYEIVRKLGEGAMGVVYEGRDPKLGRRVAIKTARRELMSSGAMTEELMQRFLREAQAAGALNHPNIVTIYDVGEEGDVSYIAMEYLEGSDLRDVIADRRCLSVEEVVNLGAVIAEALSAAHAQGIVHRDVKPANIFVQTDGRVKITDFGIARVIDSTLTQEGTLIGTPHYMSPEQFMGQRVDGRSDLFSLGVILYELLTGEKPFSGEAISTVMHQCLRVDPIPPEDLNFAVPKPLGGVVMKAMSKRPDGRYPDGRALAAALREILKPDPDPSVLKCTPAASEGERTVIVPSDNLGATTLSSAPPPGVEEAIETARLDVSVKEDISPPLSPTPSGASSRHRALMGIAAVLAVFIVVLAGWLLPARDAEVTTPKGNGVPATVPIRVSVEVFLARDLDTYLEVDSAMAARTAESGENGDSLYAAVARLEQSGRIVRVPGASVSVRNATDNTVLGEAVTDSDGQCSVTVNATPPNVIFDIRHGAFEREIPMQGERRWQRTQYFAVRE